MSFDKNSILFYLLLFLLENETFYYLLSFILLFINKVQFNMKNKIRITFTDFMKYEFIKLDQTKEGDMPNMGDATYPQNCLNE